MQFGFGAPVIGLLSGPRDLARIVSGGEAMGYDYCTISDHVMMPRDIDKKYPYTDTGELPRRAGSGRHEQLTCVAFVAAKTEKLRLVTSVTVVPHRPPVLTAKIIATIDVLSEGRFTWGIGVGWCREEFEAIGTEPFPERGAVTDETIAVCRELWTNENPSFNGKYAKFSNVFFRPLPVQRRVPIWVGGESGPAMRRTATLGDAWYPIGTNPRTGSTRWSGCAPATSAFALGRRTPAAARRMSVSPIGSCKSAARSRRRPTTATAGSAPAIIKRSPRISGLCATLASSRSISALAATPRTRSSPKCAASARMC